MEKSINSLYCYLRDRFSSYINILQVFLSESEAQQPVRGEPQPVWAADDEQTSHIPGQPLPRRAPRRPARGSGTESRHGQSLSKSRFWDMMSVSKSRQWDMSVRKSRF